MPICTPCQPTHTAAVCGDVVHGRAGVERRCYCQHKPRPGAVPTSAPDVVINGHTQTTTTKESRWPTP